jgi:hypothetical protein
MAEPASPLRGSGHLRNSLFNNKNPGQRTSGDYDRAILCCDVGWNSHQQDQSAHVIAISWQAQRRLHRSWQRLDAERGKRRTLVAVAVARELAGFCWAITTAD